YSPFKKNVRTLKVDSRPKSPHHPMGDYSMV
ncbi:MAG: hypothetical protein ACI97A_004067, partial [Planctomycetota bacterium]